MTVCRLHTLRNRSDLKADWTGNEPARMMSPNLSKLAIVAFLVFSGITQVLAAESCRADYTILGRPDEYVQSSTEGVKLAVRRWAPFDENFVKSVIVFHHGGVGWHSGYSEIMGQSMKQAGIAVLAYDTVGSGYSDSIKGHRQYIDSMETVANDLTVVLNFARDQFPNKKVFAMGESFGGMVLLTQILKEQKENEANLADGYVLAGPVVKVLRE